MLKPVYSKFILLIFLLLQCSTLYAMDHNVYYVGVSVGRTTLDLDGKSENGTLTEVLLGQYYNESDFAFEAAYTELDKYNIKTTAGSSSTDTEYDIKGLKFLANKNFLYTPTWYMNVKGGLIYWQEDTTTTIKNAATETKTDDTNRGTSIYVGLGYSYSMTKDSRVNLTIERFNTDNAKFADVVLGIIFSL